MNINTMPAGRELDALVATKVMGWRTAHFDASYGKWIGVPLDDYWEDVPAYSTDLAAAWPLLDRFGFVVGPHFQAGWSTDPSGMPRDGWFVFRDWESSVRSTFDEDSDRWALAIAETLPLALCRAALKMVRQP